MGERSGGHEPHVAGTRAPGAAATVERDPRAALPDADSAAWRRQMGAALTDGNLGAMADLLLAGIASPASLGQQR